MHRQTGRFVDDQQVSVLVHDAEGNRLCFYSQRMRRRNSHLYNLVAAQEVRWPGGTTIDGDEPIVDQTPCARTGEVGAMASNEGVKTLLFVLP
jgi:hypothetical protein